MADYTHIIPFIKLAEGGYVNNPLDAGGETNKGITYTTWKSVFGNNAHDRFMTMADADWNHIFKTLFWDAMLGDQINSQRIADIIADWVWGSGKYYPEANVQDILIHSFNQQIARDGDFGPMTIAAINAVDEAMLWDALIAKRTWYFNQCVALRPTNKVFLQGWLNRLNNLVTFETTGKLVS